MTSFSCEVDVCCEADSGVSFFSEQPGKTRAASRMRVTANPD
jgi:hypothetical protein